MDLLGPDAAELRQPGLSLVMEAPNERCIALTYRFSWLEAYTISGNTWLMAIRHC